MKQLSVDICIPTYNAENIILPTLKNILKQNYSNYKIIISDDSSTDQTISVIKKLKNPKIKIYTHTKNVGYENNLKRIEKYSTADIIFLMGQDDLIINDGLKQTISQFNNPKISAVTRPYYWFFDDVNQPIRHIPPISQQNQTIDINKNPSKIIPLIESLGQLSGLAYRRKYFTHFNPHCFTSHIQPFLEITLKHPIVFLSSYTIAVSTKTSQTRFKSKIYDTSPLKTWIDMLNKVFKKYPKLNQIAVNHVTKNYLGLIQIKNYSNYKNLIREIWIMIKYQPKNLLSIQFYFLSLLCLITPRRILQNMTDIYKSKINSRTINHDHH